MINYTNNAERASTLLKELEAIPSTQPDPAQPRFLSLRADCADRAAVGSLVTQTLEQMGRLDVVVSNAGWTRMTTFANLDENVVDEDWDRCFVMNVKTHLWLMHAALPALEASQGAFISTASVAGVKPGGSSLAYSVTKAAQIHLAKGLAVAGGPKGVRVNCVSPGMMLTEWGLKFPEKKREAAIKNTKLGRLATVEDVAALVRTMSESLSMTGQNINIDGGSSV